MRAVAGFSEWVALEPDDDAPAVGEVLAVLRERIRSHGTLGRRQHGWLLDGFARVTKVLPIISLWRNDPRPEGDHLEWFGSGQVAFQSGYVLWRANGRGGHVSGNGHVDLASTQDDGVALRLERCPCPTCGGRTSTEAESWELNDLDNHLGWVPCPTCQPPSRPVSVTWHGPLGAVASWRSC